MFMVKHIFILKIYTGHRNHNPYLKQIVSTVCSGRELYTSKPMYIGVLWRHIEHNGVAGQTISTTQVQLSSRTENGQFPLVVPHFIFRLDHCENARSIPL